MKKLLTILLLFVATISFAQEPIIGTWKFALENKINADVLLEQANSFGYDFNEGEELLLFVKLATVVVSRCENSEVTISEYKNTVLIHTKNYHDPTITYDRWGKWVKINDNQYRLKFDDGGVEIYRYDDKKNVFYLDSPEHQEHLLSKLLSNNLKLIKK